MRRAWWQVSTFHPKFRIKWRITWGIGLARHRVQSSPPCMQHQYYSSRLMRETSNWHSKLANACRIQYPVRVRWHVVVVPCCHPMTCRNLIACSVGDPCPVCCQGLAPSSSSYVAALRPCASWDFKYAKTTASKPFDMARRCNLYELQGSLGWIIYCLRKHIVSSHVLKKDVQFSSIKLE